jgi:hypothetical protein
MPGFWQVSIEATASGGVNDTVTYNICIPN